MNQITKNNLNTIFFLLSYFYFLNTNAQTVTTFAGSTQGFVNGTGTAAQFWNPSGVVIANDGTIYVADTYNNRIRKITTTGVVTTLAGSSQGFADGTGTSAKFYSPEGLAVDIAGNVYVADTFNNRIRKITTAGVVTTLAGNATQGFADGTGTSAKFNWPQGLTVDANGNVFVADTGNVRIRKITTAGVVTTIAGSSQGVADGTGTSAQFDSPQGLAINNIGTIFVADTYNNRIRKITDTGVVTTLAESIGQFYYPHSLTVDSTGNLFVADTENNRIRIITTSGVVTTLAGSTGGYADGIGTLAQFNVPAGVFADTAGNLFVSDSGNNRIRKITNALSATNFQLENQVSLYPNPASTFITIELKDITASNVNILDMNGRIIYSENIIENNTTINTSNLETGIYLIQIATDKGTVSKKILKR
ncbi:T9SS type A sorting domain-containing protein [Flavobacterium sp. N1994]|uniref:T9SS type A sorting domain-containing protein n=1 Tax=Flavobacterium sp. N1994 TaxID=2986827 RepID=UPI00222156D5|nr:T9SS type A sorting domain-containing protein [Flavobacterium sp. N1994]